MKNNKKIAVVVPAYNEEKFICETISSIPEWVDLVIAVNDKSSDSTLEILHNLALSNQRLKVINQPLNLGVGGSIISGYKYALSENIEICSVMAGDGQMDPDELHKLVDVVSNNPHVFAKGNRFYSRESIKGMPRARVLGSVLLTALTRIATGFWTLRDPQNGFVCVSNEVLSMIPLDNISKRYDFENDFLCWVATFKLTVEDVNIPARYRGEISTLSIATAAPIILGTLIRGFFRRLRFRITGQF